MYNIFTTLADMQAAALQGRPLPLSASQLSLGPATPSAAHPQRAGAAEGSEETLSPRPAGEVDAEAAAEWEAHVTAKLRAQVAAELQVRRPLPTYILTLNPMAAAEWEAHVTAKLRVQVAAELQARRLPPISMP